jgi:hypothetical protein
MTELFAGNVEVNYGQAYIELDGAFQGAMDECFLGQSNGLCGAQSPAILFLMTGLHTGPVGLTIHLFDTDPGADENWEEIVEVSFQAPNGEITLMEWAADQGAAIALPSGAYRARYSGRAMQAANDLDTNIEDDPVDHYRLDLWRAPMSPDRIVKQTSAVAAYWHDWASKLVVSE